MRAPGGSGGRCCLASSLRPQWPIATVRCNRALRRLCLAVEEIAMPKKPKPKPKPKGKPYGY